MKTINIKTSLPVNNMVTIDNFQDIISIVQIQQSSDVYINTANPDNQKKELIPADLSDQNAFMMILVQKGHAEISLDYKTYHITPNKLAFIIPNHIFRILNMSNDYIATFLKIDSSFFEEIMQERKGSFNYISFSKNPVITLDSVEKEDLQKAFLLLQEKIKLRTHFFQKEIVQNITVTLILDFLNVLTAKKTDLIYTMFSRQEDIVDKFFKLLAEHAKEQHMLTFYADKLFVSPKYLSVVLKKLTGKTGSKWINEALVLEAKKLIKSPQSNIQEVAYALNFTDQSAFGKFFKKSMGVSPLLYRRS